MTVAVNINGTLRSIDVDPSMPLLVGARGAFMPPFADSPADAEVAELAAYLRSRYSNRAAWPKLMNAAATARKQVAP